MLQETLSLVLKGFRAHHIVHKELGAVIIG